MLLKYNIKEWKFSVIMILATKMIKFGIKGEEFNDGDFFYLLAWKYGLGFRRVFNCIFKLF